MKPNILIHRYAKAFLELAIQNDVVDKVLDDLLLLNTVLKGNKELEILLHQPFVSKTHKKNIMNKILNDKANKTTNKQAKYRFKFKLSTLTGMKA